MVKHPNPHCMIGTDATDRSKRWLSGSDSLCLINKPGGHASARNSASQLSSCRSRMQGRRPCVGLGGVKRLIHGRGRLQADVGLHACSRRRRGLTAQRAVLFLFTGCMANAYTTTVVWHHLMQCSLIQESGRRAPTPFLRIRPNSQPGHRVGYCCRSRRALIQGARDPFSFLFFLHHRVGSEKVTMPSRSVTKLFFPFALVYFQRTSHR